MNDHLLFGLWKAAWKKHIKQLDDSKWDKKEWREPFQLLGAALIYSYNALKYMPEQVLHSNIRKAMEDPQRIWKSLSDQEPDFCQNTEERFEGLYATMHLASSSFRLPTALFLIDKEILNQAVGPLWEFLKDKPSDWNRDKLTNYLKNTKDLGCCQQGICLDMETAFAMVMAHRDEFAHGEEGEGKREWNKIRKECFETFHFCQILQAQLKLTELGSDELLRIK